MYIRTPAHLFTRTCPVHFEFWESRDPDFIQTWPSSNHIRIKTNIALTSWDVPPSGNYNPRIYPGVIMSSVKGREGGHTPVTRDILLYFRHQNTYNLIYICD